MNRIDWQSASPAARGLALARPTRIRGGDIRDRVGEILSDISVRGVAGVADWAERLDGFPPRRIDITDAVVAEATARTEPEDREALRIAADAVRTFHEADRPIDGAEIETLPGVFNRRVWRPLRSVGLYAPGGTAPLFSTLLMLAIPAEVAGVGERVVVTPPSADGEADPMMILAAREAGLDALWLIGGAQAVGALAFGAGLPKVDKIFGPGNAWVAEAKRQAADWSGGPAIDLPAGPSELLVIADGDADARVVAADLLGQAEHDADAQVILVTDSADLAEAAIRTVEQQLDTLPRRDTALASLAAGSIIVVRDLDQAVEVANLYAPEHLSLQVADAERLVGGIVNAGTVFMGAAAAETFGDYLSGPSHVLPTDGAARTFSGVTTAAFMKSFAVQRIDPAALASVVPAAARLARLEGLEAHARAAEARLTTVVR